VPRLPEALWSGRLGRHWGAIRRGLEEAELPGHPALTIVEDATNGLWLYRANTRPRPRARRPCTDRIARVPVQLVVPRRDLYLSPRL
jgi:hypothetical protein